MRLCDIEKYNITREELDMITEKTKGLSDFCEMTDGTWGIEWDTEYGRYWERFETEEDAEVALDRHCDMQLSLLQEVRAELARLREAAKKDAIEKGKRIAAKKRFIKEQKTIGGQCPELGELLIKMRNERRAG